tara:strand:- start:1169 stop:1795 length:627 start_codon:yes stop_codon:yes gene_type:complete
MKKLLLLLFLIGTFSLQATEKEITAKIVFENRTNDKLISGKFFITELNKTIEINSENDFSIKLPEKGKYQFGFYTENFDSYTYYPAKITFNKNVITIRLQEKGKDFNYSSKRLKDLEEKSELFPRNFENKKSEEDGMNFIIHGINPKPIDYSVFKEKFGVGLIYKNCVIDPLTYKRTVEHNKYIVEYLTEKFGEEWISNLPAKPFGVQ